MQKIRIISLGEIISPDIQKTLEAFSALLSDKLPGTTEKEIKGGIEKVLQIHVPLLNQFKLGNINEDDFSHKLIEAINSFFSVKITSDEFDDCWSKMYPDFESYEPLLRQAIEFNRASDQALIFISFTSPKDINHLTSELAKHHIPTDIHNDFLLSIDSIPLYTTYMCKKPKADIIKDVITSLKRTPILLPLNSLLFQSLMTGNKESDIKYICSNNRILEPTLKDDYQKTTQAAQETCTSFMVETIFWDKQHQSLQEVLLNPQLPQQAVAASRL
jgi:hypothetical protein